MQRLQEKPRHARGLSRRHDTRYDPLHAEADNEWAFTHFSGVPKLGINPGLHSKRKNYGSPTGIYGWPAKMGLNVPYASDRRYIALFEVKPEYRDKILILSHHPDQENFSSDELISLITKSGVLTEPELKRFNKSFPSEPVSCARVYRILALALRVDGRKPNAIRWATMFRKWGFEGVYDKGTSSIWTGEPTQAVFFSIKPLSVLSIIDQDRGEKDKRNQYFERKISELIESLPASSSEGFEYRHKQNHLFISMLDSIDDVSVGFSCSLWFYPKERNFRWRIEMGVNIGTRETTISDARGEDIKEIWNQCLLQAKWNSEEEAGANEKYISVSEKFLEKFNPS